MNNSNISLSRSQYYEFKNVEIPDEVSELSEELSDKSKRTGKERPWRRYKIASSYLAIAYEDVDIKKAERLQACGNCLTFEVDANGVKRLTHADSCRVRLCPLCSWRRSLKSYCNTMSIINYFNEHNMLYSYVFVTLTIKNCDAEHLSETIDLLYASMKRFTQRKEIKKAFKGSVRNLEVTHNVDRKSASFDTYHPHFHCLFATNRSYFKDAKIYLSRKEIARIWKECLQVDYDVQVDVRACYDTTAHAVAETSKYASKPSEYLIFDDWDMTVETVRTLDSALANRRLINYGGIFRDVKCKLKLDDVDDGDLVHIGDDGIDLEGRTHKEIYFWYSGYSQYYKIDN